MANKRLETDALTRATQARRWASVAIVLFILSVNSVIATLEDCCRMLIRRSELCVN